MPGMLGTDRGRRRVLRSVWRAIARITINIDPAIAIDIDPDLDSAARTGLVSGLDRTGC